MTYNEKQNFEEYLDIVIGKLLNEAKRAESYAKRQRELIQVFTEAKRKLWTQEADDPWLD